MRQGVRGTHGVRVCERGLEATLEVDPWPKSAQQALDRGEEPPPSGLVEGFRKGTHWRLWKNGESRWDPSGARAWHITREDALAQGCTNTYAVDGAGWADPEFRKRYAPAALPPTHLAKIRRTIREKELPGERAALGALPRISGEERFVGSSLRAKVSDWFTSELGKIWLQRRAELFAHPEAADEQEACDGDGAV